MDNDGIWRAALLKATPVMLLTIVISAIALVPAYVMTEIMIEELKMGKPISQ